MINFNDVTTENIKRHSSKWPQIQLHLYRILRIRGSGSWTTNSLFILISQQPHIDKISLYLKDPYEAKYYFFVKKWKIADLKYLNDCKVFIQYSNDMDDIYKNIEECNPSEKYRTIIVFDDMIANIFSNKKQSSSNWMIYQR